jgi:L-aminopeptidase/D-esterase-like protein
MTQPGNTTLTVLVTNVKLSDYSLNQLARQVHSSMHRAIQPFHTENDGDVLFALTTDDIELTSISPTGLATLASEVAWDAVLSSAD